MQQWLVIANGVVSSVHNSVGSAQQAAILMKTALPDGYVAFFVQSMQVATIGELQPTPNEPTQPSPTQQPVGPTPQPVVPTPQPVTPTPQPVTPTPQPVTPTKQPVNPTPEPNPPPTPQPVDPTPSPVNPTVGPTPSPVSSAALVWGKDATPLDPAWSKPEIFQPYQDPAYGTVVTRVTSAAGTRFDRNTYSRRQPENSSGSMFFTYHGSTHYHVYERVTGALVRSLETHPDAEPQWHPTDPNKIRYLEGPNSYDGDLILFEVNVATGEATTVADFRTQIRAIWSTADYMKDRAEGSASKDGNRYAWIVYDDNENVLGIVSCDISTTTVLGHLSVANFPSAGFLDSVSMSPSGKYVVTSQYEGTYVFDADMTNRKFIYANSEHSDIGIGANGNDVYVWIDFDTGWLTSVDLTNPGGRTLIFDIYDQANTSIHISGKGYNKPGWIIASTYSCKVTFAWSCFKVFAVELKQNGRILNLAHTYNCGEEYWTETHAAVNRDFTRVYYNSDGQSCGIDAEVYIVDVPDFS